MLVHPDYQGKGIAGEMLERIKEKYKNYLYIEGMSEDEKNVPFYEKHGFQPVGQRKNYYQNPVEDAILMAREGK